MGCWCRCGAITLWKWSLSKLKSNSKKTITGDLSSVKFTLESRTNFWCQIVVVSLSTHGLKIYSRIMDHFFPLNCWQYYLVEQYIKGTEYEKPMWKPSLSTIVKSYSAIILNKEGEKMLIFLARFSLGHRASKANYWASWCGLLVDVEPYLCPACVYSLIRCAERFN